MGNKVYIEKPLEELVDVYDSLRKPVTSSDRKSGPYPYYGASGISDYVDSFIFDGEYLLLSEDGDNLRTRNTPIAFLANGKFWVNNHAHVLQGNLGNDTKYLCYALQIADITSYLSGSTRPKLNQKDMRRIPVYAPPLPEQKATAHILGSLDDKIELNRQMNATLEGMAQALFKSWFVDFDPVIDNALAAANPIPDALAARAQVRRQLLADGRANREAAKPFPATFYFAEELGWIPEGWKAIVLNNAIQINPKVTLSKGTIATYADMKSLPTDGYNIDGVIEKAYAGGAKFQNDDVLLARITPCLENGKTGIVDFLADSNAVGFGSTEFIVLRGKNEITLPYVACLAREQTFRLHCIQSMVGSSGRQRVQNSCFDSFHVAIPTELTTLTKFIANTNPAFQKMSKHAQESKTLANLRDTLLPKLISGELRIPDAEKLVAEVL